MMKYVSVTCTSRPTAARKRPVSPPIVKRPMNPIAYSIGVSHEIDPLYIVAVQLKTLTADGIATRKLRIEKISAAYTDWPGHEHVVAPDEEAEHRDAEAGERHERVAEHLLAAEGGDQLADDAHRRQNHDVDRRVRIEPEQVLEQHRIAADRRIEDAEVEQPLGRDQQDA